MVFADVLARRVRSDAASPLLTCYAAAGRTELSAVTYANWVAKTATMIIDTLEAEPGDVVALPLLARHAGHWMGLVWVGACWTAGVTAVPSATIPDGVAAPVIEVAGPEPEPAGTADHRLACSLHPLALGIPGGPPVGWLDWAVEVRSEPDVYLGGPADPADAAWIDDDRRLSGADLLTTTPRAGRGLVDGRVAGSAWTVAELALLAPLLGGGSTVLVLDGDADEIAAAEHVTS